MSALKTFSIPEKPILPPVAETLEYDSEDPERNINGWIFAFSFGELAPLNKENTMHLGKFLFLPEGFQKAGANNKKAQLRNTAQPPRIFLLHYAYL